MRNKVEHTGKRMKINTIPTICERTLIIGGGMAGLSAAISLASQGEAVLLLEAGDIPGGKMRVIETAAGPVDCGPTVFTMRYVFEHLFAKAGVRLEDVIKLEQTEILARHAWNSEGTFDLYANRQRSEDEIGRFFSKADAEGYRRFCDDGREIFETLKESFIGAPRPGPIELARRVGAHRLDKLLALRPTKSLWSALKSYFPDPRLRQLFGRYATYVGSSPWQAPATLMLIAHVEQEGVWLISGGMHALAKAMAKTASELGANIRYGSAVKRILTDGSRAAGVELANGELITASRILHAGDVSDLPRLLDLETSLIPKPVPEKKRSLSALTWSMAAKCKGFDLHRHNVFFSDDYSREFQRVFKRHWVPDKPTVYVCAQDRNDTCRVNKEDCERLFVLMNAPAFGDRQTLSSQELKRCQQSVETLLSRCGMDLEVESSSLTQPSDFASRFPGSGGAIYGRASHGWMASFARPGATTKLPGLYLAGGSVHPGPGVPMATLSGMLAAEQICKDRVST